MRKLILLTTLITLSLKTSGCTCDHDLKEEDLIERSEYAFIGLVISNIYKDEWSRQFGGVEGLKMDASVRVLKVLKGEILSDEVIVISSESSECEINLIPGRRYLITGTKMLNKLAPPESDSLLSREGEPIFKDTEIREQPNIKNRGDWIRELQQKQLVIFTSVCQTRYKR